MLAKIGNILGLSDAGHAPPRQVESGPARDFGAYVAAARMAKSDEQDGSAASRPGAGDAAQVEEAGPAKVDYADVAQPPETDTDPDADAAPPAADPVAVGAREDASAGLVTGASLSPEDKRVEAGLVVARAATEPETGARTGDASDELAGARPAAAFPDMATIPRGQGKNESPGTAASIVAAQGTGTRWAEAHTGGAKQPAALLSEGTAPTATPAGAATSAPVAPGKAGVQLQPVAVDVQGTSSAAGATSEEFARHRATLQAEKLAQLVSAGGDAARVDKAPDGAVHQSAPGAIGPVDRAGLSRKVETLIRNAGSAAEPAVRTAEGGSASVRAAAGAVAAVTAPAAAFTTAIAPQAVVAAGITHPSILDVADDADAPDIAVQGGAGELRAGSTQPTVLAQPSRADAAAVVRQISESMPRAGNGTIEIRLSPDELGHVRLQMVPGESGMIVHIQAERAETLDLLRRHVDQLARDLAESGHDASGFTFAEGRDGQGRGSEPGGEGAAGADLSRLTTSHDVGEGDAAQDISRADGGLDIKI